MSHTTPAPVVTAEDLLTRLIEQFPLALPDMTDSDREVWRRVGQQEVLARCRRLLDGDLSDPKEDSGQSDDPDWR